MEGGNAAESLPFVISFLLVLPRDGIFNPLKLAIYHSIRGAFELQKVGGQGEPLNPTVASPPASV